MVNYDEEFISCRTGKSRDIKFSSSTLYKKPAYMMLYESNNNNIMENLISILYIMVLLFQKL